MAKKNKQSELNLYYMGKGQAQKETIEDMMKRKKAKEREKRIKANQTKKSEEGFDLETETVIQMTNQNKIRKEQEQKRAINKQEQKRKKRNRKIKLFLEIVVIIGLIAGGVVFASTSPIFNIKEINVVNNNLVPSDEIISLSQLKTGENIFKFFSPQIINNIKENPYVEEIKIHRNIPNKVTIDVEERVPTYNIDFMGQYAYINTQGYILEISSDSKQLPIIEGSVTPEEEILPGKRLNREDLENLEEVIKITNSANENGLNGKVKTIDISNKSDYSFYIEEEKKRVHLGDNSNISNKMLYVVAIIEQEKGKEGDIFVNGDLNNKFQPYFREKV